MALALLLQQRKEKNAKPGKGESFGIKFKANFVLEGSTIKPFGTLSGQLVLESPTPILHYGIRVQFEAACTLKFETKLDNRKRYVCKSGNLLQGGGDKDMVDGYLESPVKIDLEPIIKDSSQSKPYELQAGTNTYGFNITIPGEVLPSPFKNPYGTLVYKLGAYMQSENGAIVQIGEKTLKFGGYLNLAKTPEAAKSASIERSVKRSMFTGKKLVIVTLNLDSCGYLPEDTLCFGMRVQNPKCLPYKMSVQLIQKVIYSASGTKKTTVAIVGSADKEINEPESETVWDGSFKVHKGVSPTYIGRNSMYQVSHVVQFKVKLDDYNAMKAEQPVYIGTTREPIEALIASINNMNLTENGNTKSTERRNSGASIQSTSSSANANSTVSKPLSQISSRLSTEAVPFECEDTSSSTESNFKRPIPEGQENISEDAGAVGGAASGMSSSEQIDDNGNSNQQP